MEKLDQDIPAPEGPKSLLTRLRKWLKSRFGRSHEPRSNVKVYTHLREEIPELMPKAKKVQAPETPKLEPTPSSDQNSSESKIVAKAKPSQGPVIKIKPKKIRAPKVPNLSNLSPEEFAKRLTGETHLEDEEIHRLINPSSKDLAAKNEPTKDIRLTTKDYPSKIENKDEDELNLHGKTAVEAERAIRLFIIEMQRKSKRLVRVITGQGHNSDPEKGPVLKGVAVKEIQKLKDERKVFKFEWERGNKGALLVYLT
jgi:DNA-nicking Smr family endonuclease